jgi:hypothetical protein
VLPESANKVVRATTPAATWRAENSLTVSGNPKMGVADFRCGT